MENDDKMQTTTIVVVSVAVTVIGIILVFIVGCAW